MTDKHVNTLAECVSIEASTLGKVVPKYAKVATELAILFAGDNGDRAVHAYMCAAQDSNVNGDAWNRAVTGLGKALGKLPDPLKFSAKRDFRPTHRDKAPLFTLVRIADANSERKELARIAKEQADAFDAANAVDAQKAKEEADAATTEEMVAAAAIDTVTRLGLDMDRLASIFRPVSDFHNIVDLIVNGEITGTKEILDIVWAGFSVSQQAALFKLCNEKVPAKKAA
jgi:hypothetical protein